MQTTDPLLVMLHTWARWCRMVGDIGPVGYKNSGCCENMAKPYKTLICETEALDEMERRAKPHEATAARVELWVSQLPVTPRTALRVHWVYAPEEKRREEHLDYDQWQERRVWTARKRLKALEVDHWNLTRQQFEREVGEGMAIMREVYATWVEGV